MKWFAVLLLVISLCCVHAENQKKVLLVGPDGSALIFKYCAVPTVDVLPLREYSCFVNEEQVTMITAPEYQGINELDGALNSISSFDPLSVVALMWPLSPQTSFDSYLPVTLSFLPYIQSDQRPFVVMSVEHSENNRGYQELKQMMGIKNEMLADSNRDYLTVFEDLVAKIDTSVHVHKHACQHERHKIRGCLASLNVVDTRGGQKLIKDVEVGDEILTPRGYMPVLYVEDHPNMTFPCVHYGGVWLTEDHFIYSEDTLYKAGEISNTTMQVQLEVRTVVVKGDSFFCHHALVSSYSRFRWLPTFSLVIDHMPTRLLSLTRTVSSLFL